MKQASFIAIQQMKHQGMVCALLVLRVGAGLTDGIHSVVDATSTRVAFRISCLTK